MIGTQRAARPRPHSPRERPVVRFPDAMALAESEAEFFVEWQVADGFAVAPAGGAEK